MACSGFGLRCSHALLAGGLGQRSCFSSQIFLPTEGSEKRNVFQSRGLRPWNVRCHNETLVLDAPDRAACPSVKAEIDSSAFANVDLRVGLITGAKPVNDPEMSAKRGKPTDSRRYLQLTVDIGCETRTMISECKYVMDVEDAVGKKVLVVANVPPVEILGIESHGLILTGFNYDPTPMPRSFKVILPGLGRLPPGSQVAEAAVPK